MMNIVVRSILALTLIGATTIGQAQDSKLTLKSSYQIKLGDYAALILPELLKVRTDLDAPTVTTYEPEPNTIDVEIYGSRGTAEGAKETILNYMAFIQTAHIPYLSRRFGLTLTDQDYRIVYYDRSARGGPKVILQYVNGQYTLPSR